jgi:Beta-lactamase class C and other penicillin binding proteins
MMMSDKKIVTFECGVKNSISLDPITSSTVFEAASLSKPLIAYAALELCENGRLEMDKPLSAYLQSPESEDPFLSAVTLRHVLSHTGGFPTANLKPGDPLKLEFYPGTQFAYSGESYCYLGRVIEQITGDSLASYMQEHVLTP